MENARQHLNGGGLTSAIWPDKGQHLASFERERDGFDGLALAILRRDKRAQTSGKTGGSLARLERLRYLVNFDYGHSFSLLVSSLSGRFSALDAWKNHLSRMDAAQRPAAPCSFAGPGCRANFTQAKLHCHTLSRIWNKRRQVNGQQAQRFSRCI